MTKNEGMIVMMDRLALLRRVSGNVTDDHFRYFTGQNNCDGIDMVNELKGEVALLQEETRLFRQS